MQRVEDGRRRTSRPQNAQVRLQFDLVDWLGDREAPAGHWRTGSVIQPLNHAVSGRLQFIRNSERARPEREQLPLRLSALASGRLDQRQDRTRDDGRHRGIVLSVRKTTCGVLATHPALRWPAGLFTARPPHPYRPQCRIRHRSSARRVGRPRCCSGCWRGLLLPAANLRHQLFVVVVGNRRHVIRQTIITVRVLRVGGDPVALFRELREPIAQSRLLWRRGPQSDDNNAPGNSDGPAAARNVAMNHATALPRDFCALAYLYLAWFYCCCFYTVYGRSRIFSLPDPPPRACAGRTDVTYTRAAAGENAKNRMQSVLFRAKDVSYRSRLSISRWSLYSMPFSIILCFLVHDFRLFMRWSGMFFWPSLFSIYGRAFFL